MKLFCALIAALSQYVEGYKTDEVILLSKMINFCRKGQKSQNGQKRPKGRQRPLKAAENCLSYSIAKPDIFLEMAKKAKNTSKEY